MTRKAVTGFMPGRMYFIDDSQATLDGTDLGRPAHLRACPTIGEVTLPARGVLAIGQAIWTILDPAEYEHMRSQTSAAEQTGEAPRRQIRDVAARGKPAPE